MKKIKSIFKEAKYDMARQLNDLPKDSNWTDFASMFDIGVLDLDKFAYLMKFKNFENLDMSISPKDLLRKKGKKFIEALRDSSLKANKMSDKEIINSINSLWP